jgi:hypothetical protein
MSRLSGSGTDSLMNADESSGVFSTRRMGETEMPCSLRLKLAEAYRTNAGHTRQALDPSTAVVQYIDRSDKDGVLHDGQDVHVRARVEWKAASSDSLAGQHVYFYFVAAADNKAMDIEQVGYTKDLDTLPVVDVPTDEGGIADAKFTMFSQRGNVFALYASIDADDTKGASGPKGGTLIATIKVDWYPYEARLEEIGPDDKPVKRSFRDGTDRQLIEWPRTSTDPTYPFGRVIRVRARLQPRRSSGASANVKDMNIYLRVERRNNLSATSAHAGKPSGFTGSHGDTLTTTANEQGYSPILEYEVPGLQNGEPVEIRASAEDGGKGGGVRLVVDDSRPPTVEIALINALDDRGKHVETVARADKAPTTHEQYVNVVTIPAGDLARAEYGPTVRLSAVVKPRPPNKDVPATYEGQSVCWFIKQDGSAKDPFSPYEIEVTGGVEFQEGERKGFRTRVTAKGTTEPLTVKLTNGANERGGRRFELEARVDSRPGKAEITTGPFEVWHKLWFNVHAMIRPGFIKATTGPYKLDLTSMPACFEAAFLRLVHDKATDATFPYEENVFSDDRSLTLGKKMLSSGGKAPYKINVLAVSRIVTTADRPLKFTMQGTNASGLEFPLSDYFSDDCFEDGKGTFEGETTAQTIPKGCFKVLDGKTGYKKIDVDLTSTSLKPSPHKKLRVEATLKVASRNAAGFTGNYPHIFVECETNADLISWGPKPVKAVETVAHEIGHTLQLVPLWAKHRDVAPGHCNGGHCTSDECIMYYSLDRPESRWKNTFCPKCTELLRGGMSGISFSGVKGSYEANS